MYSSVSLLCVLRSSNIHLVTNIVRKVKRELGTDADQRRTKTAIVEVFVSAFIVAFVFSLFIARLPFTDMNFFRTAKWLVCFPVTVVVLLQLYCALTQQNR